MNVTRIKRREIAVPFERHRFSSASRACMEDAVHRDLSSTAKYLISMGATVARETSEFCHTGLDREH